MTDKTWRRVSDAFNRASAYIHRKGGYKAEYLTDKEVKPLIDETYNAFSEAVDYGLRDNEIPTAMRLYLQDNVFVFSGFKAHTELRQASALLRDASGQIKPFNRFLSDIQKIDKTYNKTYLQAEYNFAVASSQAAARWQEFAADGDDFLLQYRTAKDERVREQHRLLDGITLPPSDKFWDEYYVPLGWNCRCSVVQVNPKRYPESNSEEAIQRGRAATSQPNAKGQNKAQIFRFNPGKDKKIFPPKHPYYPKNCGNCNLKQFKAGKGKPECEVCKTLRIINRNKETIVETKKGKVYWTEKQEEELEENISTAVFLANTFDYKIKLIPNSKQHGVSTPDTINETLNILQEYKLNTKGTLRSIEDSIRRGRKQAHYIVIRFDVEVKKQETINYIKSKIRYLNNNMGNDPRNLEIEEVLILFDDNDFEKIKRE